LKIFSILCAIELSLGSKIGQNPQEVGQNLSEVEQNRLKIGHILPEVGLNRLEIGQNLPEIGKNRLGVKQNLPEIGRNRLEIEQNFPDVGHANIKHSGQLVADGSSNRFFISDYTFSINLIPFLLLLKVAFILGE
jgi:hypothetical protein